MIDDDQLILPLPCELPEQFRYAQNANGTPALRVCVILGEQQAMALNEWFDDRCKRLKADKWHQWNVGDMALRTLCFQIDEFAKRAFRGGRR